MKTSMRGTIQAPPQACIQLVLIFRIQQSIPLFKSHAESGHEGGGGGRGGGGGGEEAETGMIQTIKVFLQESMRLVLDFRRPHQPRVMPTSSLKKLKDRK